MTTGDYGKGGNASANRSNSASHFAFHTAFCSRLTQAASIEF